MKIKYILIFIILLIVGNFLRLFVETSNIPKIDIKEEISYNKEKAKKESDLSQTDKKFDVNNVEFDELLKLGFSKTKSEKLIEFREKVGIIQNLDDLKNVKKFGESGLKQAKKYLFVDDEKIKNPNESYGRNFEKFNINELDEDELKMIGFTKKEIKQILVEIKKDGIRSNLDLEKIIGVERYSEFENKIKFSE